MYRIGHGSSGQIREAAPPAPVFGKPIFHGLQPFVAIICYPQHERLPAPRRLISEDTT